MLIVEALPAQRGDCLWIEYGAAEHPHRILIDCGPPVSWKLLRDRISKVPEGKRHFELFVVTHIDDDHIGSALKLLDAAKDLGLSFGDVWFNGRSQLAPELGAVQGEQLTEKLDEGKHPWNMAFRKAGTSRLPAYDEAVVVRATGTLPVVELADGLAITLLSPLRAQLDALLPVWEKELKKAGLLGSQAALDDEETVEAPISALDVDTLADGREHTETTAANASGIAFLVEYGEVACLFAADAHADVLASSIERLAKQRKQERLPLDLFKVSHHASAHNTSRRLLGLVDCPEYLVSTNGAQFRHPSAEAIAKIVKYGGKKPQIHFNYRTEFNAVWDDAALRKKWGHEPTYPKADRAGVKLVWDDR